MSYEHRRALLTFDFINERWQCLQRGDPHIGAGVEVIVLIFDDIEHNLIGFIVAHHFSSTGKLLPFRLREIDSKSFDICPRISNH